MAACGGALRRQPFGVNERRERREERRREMAMREGDANSARRSRDLRRIASATVLRLFLSFQGASHGSEPNRTEGACRARAGASASSAPDPRIIRPPIDLSMIRAVMREVGRYAIYPLDRLWSV